MKFPSILSAMVALCLPCFLSGCSNEVASPAEVAGTYKFEYKEGPVEVWVISANFKFDQRFYQSVANYKESRPFLVYQNDWAFESGTAMPALSFKRSYSLMDPSTWSPMSAPEIVTGGSAVWLKPKDGEAASLDFFSERGYIAVRVE